MWPSVDLDGLKKPTAGEYALRFIFGGVVTALAAMIASRWGAAVGGLFLAFPAILPATLTLVTQHDGRQAADDVARGAILGAAALLVFALTSWMLIERASPPVALALSLGAWVACAVFSWKTICGVRRSAQAPSLRPRRRSA